MTSGAGLAGAVVSVDQINLYDGKATVRRHHVGETRTDENGYFEPIPTGSLAGLFLVRSSGGTFRDPISGATIRLDPSFELHALHWLDFFEDRSTTAYVTPVHSLVEAHFRQAMDAPGDTNVTAALNEAYQRIGAHFGGLDWEQVIPAEVDEPAVSPTDDVRAAFVLGGLAMLADDLRAASDSTPQAVNLTTLIHSAVLDLEQDARFDGNDDNDRAPESGLQVGICPPIDSACVVPPDGCQLGACRASCDQSASSFRSMLVGAIRKYVGPRAVPTEWNQTTLGSEDLRPMLEAIGSNADPQLFGNACVETSDRVPPSLIWEAPPPESFVKGSFTVKVRATDDAEAVPTASFVGLPDTDQGPSVAVTVIDTRAATGGADGSFTITALARDAAGNERREPRAFRADNTAPVVALTATSFHVEAGVWWTGANEPVIHGTLDEQNPRVVEVLLGGEVVAQATLDGSAWSARIPAGRITGEGNEVSARATDQAGNTTTTAAVLIRLDATPPGVLVEASPVYDERNSTEFYDLSVPATNTWLQRHVTGGAPIDLAQSMNGSCATVYKFSHLLHENFVLGSTGNLNPLKTSFVVSDDGVGIEPGTQQARVTIRSGASTTEALPWTAIPGASIGPKTTRHVMGLYRDGALAIPSLATTEGEYHLELRARDKLGRTSVQERCWNHRILAPKPAPIEPGAKAEGFARAMYSTRLDPVVGQPQFGDVSAKFLNSDAAGAAVWIWKVKNYLATPVYVTVNVSRGVNAKVSRDFVIRSGLTSFRSSNTPCGTSPCPIEVPSEKYRGSVLGVDHYDVRFRARFFVMNGAETGAEILPCAGCTNDDEAQTYTFEIPPRTTPQGAPLAEYAILTYLRPTLPAGEGLDVLLAPQDTMRQDTDPNPYREVTFEGVTFTGKLVGGLSGEVCVDQDFDFGGWVCTQKARKQEYRAIANINYDWQTRVRTTYSFSAAPALSLMRPVAESLDPTGNINSWETTEALALP